MFICFLIIYKFGTLTLKIQQGDFRNIENVLYNQEEEYDEFEDNNTLLQKYPSKNNSHKKFSTRKTVFFSLINTNANRKQSKTFNNPKDFKASKTFKQDITKLASATSRKSVDNSKIKNQISMSINKLSKITNKRISKVNMLFYLFCKKVSCNKESESLTY